MKKIIVFSLIALLSVSSLAPVRAQALTNADVVTVAPQMNTLLSVLSSTLVLLRDKMVAEDNNRIAIGNIMGGITLSLQSFVNILGSAH